MFCLCKMYIKCFLVLIIFGYIDADIRYPSSTMCGYPRLENGRVRIRTRSRLVKFICLPRFELVGNKYATCRGTEWDVPLPVCVRSGCEIPQIENGIVMSSRDGAWIVYFCLPNHKMIGGSTIYCDGFRWNATAPTCVDSSAPSLLSCDFESSDLCGWTQDDLHDFDWRRLNRKTPSSFMFTGPSFDHTYGRGGSGYYMYIESTSRYQNDTARLVSPLYDRSLAVDGCFVFFYHMYGKTTGGLRVYQKPESLQLDSMLKLKNNKRYTLFEKWGNQDDVWYEGVLPLVNFYDNFQIVVEGIRGTGVTSDIAIDDVAILQGSNCTAALKPSPPPPTTDTCIGRCSISFLAPEVGDECGCTIMCITHDNCCPDFYDVCVFNNTDTSDDAASSEVPPQTQKLVATSPETTSTTTTSTSTTTTTTSTTTTHKPTTTTQRTTVTKPTTKTTKATTTVATTKRTPTTSTTTTLRPTTTKPPSTTKQTTTRKPEGTAQPVKSTTLPTSVKSTPSTTIRTTTVIIDYSMPIVDHDAYKDTEEKAKIPTKQTVLDNNVVPEQHKGEKTGSGGVKIGLIFLGVVVCCGGLAWLVMVYGSRGRWAVTRIRGRATRDPEVRYLSTDVDDD